MAGLAAAGLATIRGRLEAFADDLLASLPRVDQRARGQCYLRGLMLDVRRKSIQPMAARLGEAHYQALHHFVAVSPWDGRPVRRRLAEAVCAAPARGHPWPRRRRPGRRCWSWLTALDWIG